MEADLRVEAGSQHAAHQAHISAGGGGARQRLHKAPRLQRMQQPGIRGCMGYVQSTTPQAIATEKTSRSAWRGCPRNAASLCGSCTQPQDYQ